MTNPFVLAPKLKTNMGYRLRQPGSVLNPKPGISSPQGNAAPPFLEGGFQGKPVFSRPDQIAPGESTAQSPNPLADAIKNKPWSPYGRSEGVVGVGLGVGSKITGPTITPQNPALDMQGKPASIGAPGSGVLSALPWISGATYRIPAPGMDASRKEVNAADQKSTIKIGKLANSLSSLQSTAGGAPVGRDAEGNPIKYDQATGKWAPISQDAGVYGALGGQGSPAQITPAGNRGAEAAAAPVTPNFNIVNDATAGGAAAGGNTPPLQKVFNFFKSELERERDQGVSEANVDSARRGVFYGTPGAQAASDVGERYQRGLAQLEADLLQKEQGNEFERLRLAQGLIPQDIQDTGGLDPALMQALGSMFGGDVGGNDDNAPTNPVSKLFSNVAPKLKNIASKIPGLGGLKAPTTFPMAANQPSPMGFPTAGKVTPKISKKKKGK